MGRVRSKDGETINAQKISFGKPEGREPTEDVGVDWRAISDGSQRSRMEDNGLDSNDASPRQSGGS